MLSLSGTDPSGPVLYLDRFRTGIHALREPSNSRHSTAIPVTSPATSSIGSRVGGVAAAACWTTGGAEAGAVVAGGVVTGGVVAGAAAPDVVVRAGAGLAAAGVVGAGFGAAVVGAGRTVTEARMSGCTEQ